jgi:3-dehydroquinate synthase
MTTEAHQVTRQVNLSFKHQVLFTRDAFARDNESLRSVLLPKRDESTQTLRTVRVLLYIDRHLLTDVLREKIVSYFETSTAADGDATTALELVCPPIAMDGGEDSKNNWRVVEGIWKDINTYKICRHSYVIIVGGGASIDLVGFAVATAHRGVRLVRMPTTTLCQGDGGVGVKNGVNYFGKKNWVGSFTVPDAVINDYDFLLTLPDAHKRAGYAEAVKVSLIKDKDFFLEIEAKARQLAAFDPAAMQRLIWKSAVLHLDHIAFNGDPFEKGSARPLDFGHWIAHKLEPLSNYKINHGYAVAIGICADFAYCAELGMIPTGVRDRIVTLFEALGFATYNALLHSQSPTGSFIILDGLQEFREHLGGVLTITLITDIGRGLEVHEMDPALILRSLNWLKDRHDAKQHS